MTRKYHEQDEDEMMTWACRGVPSIQDVKKAGLEAVAEGLMAAGKLRRGTGAYSAAWTCPDKAQRAVKACKGKKAKDALVADLIREISWGHDRARSIAQAIRGTYTGKSNIMGRYP